MNIGLITLKNKPFIEQINIINKIVQDNPSLGKMAQNIIIKELEKGICKIDVSKDYDMFSKIAILTVVYSDIGTIPDNILRTMHLKRFVLLCEHFDVDFDSVKKCIPFSVRFETLIRD